MKETFEGRAVEGGRLVAESNRARVGIGRSAGRQAPAGVDEVAAPGPVFRRWPPVRRSVLV